MGALQRLRTLVRTGAVLAVALLVGVLATYLPQPGLGWLRLVLFALIAAAGVVGAVGLVTRRPTVTTAGVVCLLVLGTWQAVLGVFVLPVAALLAVAAVLDRTRPGAGDNGVAVPGV